jgi:hypothetical protein
MADQINLYLDKLRKAIEKSPASKYALLLEETTKVILLLKTVIFYHEQKLIIFFNIQVNYEYFVVGFGLIVVLSIFFGIFAELITNTIGFVYPFLSTLASLENKPAEQKKWLVYWVLFASIVLFDEYFTFVVNWIPFYYPIKTAFLLYIMVPQSNGALHVYDLAKPHIAKLLGDAVDEATSSASKKSE